MELKHPRRRWPTLDLSNALRRAIMPGMTPLSFGESTASGRFWSKGRNFHVKHALAPCLRARVGRGSRQKVLPWILLVCLLGTLWPGWAPRAYAQAESRPDYYAGWAVEAYPEQTQAELEALLRRMAAHGANVVWIGHDNPGEVDAAKVEPGLSYAVYEAYQNPADPRHADAQAIVRAQHRMLAACAALGFQAVLPIGYQIQMGEVWNEAHPDDLRRNAQGEPLDIFGGGVSASFYSPAYRRDIERYYRWIDAHFVRPYVGTILMLNLADEPIGGDYSAHAEAAFRRQFGIGFADVGLDPGRQRQLGQFQSRYVVEYAAYSAGLWERLHPGLPVTMSFDGSQARKAFTLPDVEALFRDTPPHFVVTFDAYPRDGPPHVSLSDEDLVGLFLLARSVGLYSSRYGKPVWLWAAANSWGLSQASPDPGAISDAVVNGLSLALLVRQGGGDLRGIAYWNYHVKEQGLYNDTHQTAYDPDILFQRVSASLPTLRRLMAAPASRPEVLVLAPPARSYGPIGEGREAIRLLVQPLGRLAILAKEGVNAAIVGDLEGWPLTGVRAVVVLTPDGSDLADGDLNRLRAYLRQGGKVVASPGVATALDLGLDPPQPIAEGLIEQRGPLYIAQKGMAVLFEDKRHNRLAPFWREVLGLRTPQPGYRIVTERHVLQYHRGPDPVTFVARLPFHALGARFDDDAGLVEELRGRRLPITLGRREFVWMERIAPSTPRRK